MNAVGIEKAMVRLIQPNGKIKRKGSRKNIHEEK